MNALQLPARKSSKNSTVEFTPCLNGYSRVAGVAKITTDRASGSFVVEESADDCEGVRLFVLSKLDKGTDDTEGFYTVRVRPALIGLAETVGSCSCKGFGYKFTCKHVDAVAELVKTGTI